MTPTDRSKARGTDSSPGENGGSVQCEGDKYRFLIENLREGIWEIDKDGVTTFVNPRMAEILGYPPKEMLGRHLFSFMDEANVRKAEDYLARRQRELPTHAAEGERLLNGPHSRDLLCSFTQHIDERFGDHQ